MDTKCNSPSTDLHIDVENNGDKDGAHTVFVFSSPPDGKDSTSKQLIGFKKIHIPAKSKKTVKVDFHVCDHLTVVDEVGTQRVLMGEHKIHIGDDHVHSISLQIDMEQMKS